MTADADTLDYEVELREAFDASSGLLTVSADWEGFPGRAFGGFLAGAVLVAASERSQHPRPLSFFSRYYRPAPIERALALELTSEHSGRSIETFAAQLREGDRPLSSFSVAFGRDGEAPLSGQALSPPRSLAKLRPIWQHLLEIGVEPGRVMRRVGYRGEVEPAADADDEWHMHARWPAPRCKDPAVRAAVALMAMDAFVAPAAMRANELDLDADWPVTMPSLDLNGWFYAPEEERDDGWLTIRASVPVSHAAYAVGRTQVWSGERLIAEGMSQVALIPVPPTARG